MLEITTVGLDLAKNVFQAHGADRSGRAMLRKKLRRDQVLAFFAQLPGLCGGGGLCQCALLGSRDRAARTRGAPDPTSLCQTLR